MVKTEPVKATQLWARHKIIKPRPHWSNIPAASSVNSGMSLGNPVVEMAPPKRPNNLTGGTNKNELRVIGEVEPLSRSDERRNPLNSGRTNRNWFEVFRVHVLGAEHD